MTAELQSKQRILLSVRSVRLPRHFLLEPPCQLLTSLPTPCMETEAASLAWHLEPFPSFWPHSISSSLHSRHN